MENNDQISKIIHKQLKSTDAREKYLNLLINRIEDNRKSLSSLFIIMLLMIFSFPLIVETRISEISIGPFKLQDNSFAISIIPSIFALCYYKYITIFVDLTEQKELYKVVTSQIFEMKEISYLNERLKPFSFGDSILFNHLFQAKKLGCVLGLFWLPILIILGLFPFVFEYYTVKTLYEKFGLNSFIDWLFFLTPIVTGVFTILIYNQGRRKIEKMKKEES